MASASGRQRIPFLEPARTILTGNPPTKRGGIKEVLGVCTLDPAAAFGSTRGRVGTPGFLLNFLVQVIGIRFSEPVWGKQQQSNNMHRKAFLAAFPAFPIMHDPRYGLSIGPPRFIATLAKNIQGPSPQNHFNWPHSFNSQDASSAPLTARCCSAAQARKRLQMRAKEHPNKCLSLKEKQGIHPRLTSNPCPAPWLRVRKLLLPARKKLREKHHEHARLK